MKPKRPRLMPLAAALLAACLAPCASAGAELPTCAAPAQPLAPPAFTSRAEADAWAKPVSEGGHAFAGGHTEQFTLGGQQVLVLTLHGSGVPTVEVAVYRSAGGHWVRAAAEQGALFGRAEAAQGAVVLRDRDAPTCVLYRPEASGSEHRNSDEAAPAREGSFAAAADNETDSCQEATSGIDLKFCDSKEAEKKERARERRQDQISRDWSARDRAAFGRLRREAEAFALATSRNETDQVGTGRDMFMDEAYAEVKSKLEEDIGASERGIFPSYTPDDFAALDKRLNGLYGAIMHPAQGEHRRPAIYTGIGRSGIREAQRAWLKYRDAWVAFAKVRYPQVPAHAWKARLTERRIAQLEELREEVGAGEGDE